MHFQSTWHSIHPIFLYLSLSYPSVSQGGESVNKFDNSVYSTSDQLHLPMKEKLKPLSPLAEEVFSTSMCLSLEFALHLLSPRFTLLLLLVTNNRISKSDYWQRHVERHIAISKSQGLVCVDSFFLCMKNVETPVWILMANLFRSLFPEIVEVFDKVYKSESFFWSVLARTQHEGDLCC
jgi:hypothetical protein